MKLNLAWGNPGFLQEYWKNKKLDVSVGHSEGMRYHKEGGSPALKLSILSLHATLKNIPEGHYHVVVGNGITQVAQSAIAALGARSVGAPAPYYQRFPDLAKFAGASWMNAKYSEALIITVPNNPDGSFMNEKLRHSNAIHDLCYNWPHYSGEMAQIDGDIMLFGLSKLSGHAGSRIGWALVKNEAIAKKMEKYIELQTCGISSDSQKRAEVVIKHLIEQPSFFSKGRKQLLQRWKKLIDLKVPMCNNDGMFLWTDNRKWWEDVGIQGVGGEHFGVADNHLRINIGCTNDEFDELVRRIDEHNRKSAS